MEKGSISSDFMVKSAKKDNTVISGYASVFGVLDSHNDIIKKGAFGNIEAGKVKLLWQHDYTKPIGVIKFLKEDEYGLMIEAEINNSTVAGSEAAALIKQQAVNGLSIGFAIKSSDYNQQGVREIDAIDLKEVSIVTFPANQEAGIQCVKKLDTEALSENQEKLDELSVLIKKLEDY